MKKLLIFSLFSMLITGCSVDVSTSPREQSEIYEVVSVFKYAEARTSRFGQVLSTEFYYTFDYIDKDGSIKSVDHFGNYEYGIEHIELSKDNNNYYVKTDSEHYLYLTKEAMSNINSSN